MKTSKNLSSVLAISSLILAMLACNFGKADATPTPLPPTNPPPTAIPPTEAPPVVEASPTPVEVVPSVDTSAFEAQLQEFADEGYVNTTEGEIYFQGKKRDIRSGRKKKEYWKNIQAIFQDPFSAYNTFHKIDAVLMDCIKMRGGGGLPHEQKITMMRDACSFVNLKFAELTNKYPFELSGGQMQRLMIARIFLLKPKILIADEPTSMIDACSRATILEYLMKLRNETGMTLIFITHDIGLAYYVSDTVYIMERGKFVERGTADEVILRPQQPYTRRLISDVPKIYEEWDLSTV